MKRFLFVLIAVLGLSFGSQLTSKAQFYSLSSNIPALGWAGMNAEISATVDRTWSLHADFSYNPFRVERLRTQHFIFRPQVRYWFDETYRNWFVGLHYIYANYHFGIGRIMPHKYEGWGVGGGLDTGFALPVGRKWNVEFQLGGSIMWMNYIKCINMNCGDRVSAESGVRFLPTKAAISLVYLF